MSNHKLQAHAETAREVEVEVEIKQGYQPGILGRCLEMHMENYSRSDNFNFGSSFESQLSTDLESLLSRLSPENLNDEVWAAVLEGKIVGTVWIDGGVRTPTPIPTSTSKSECESDHDQVRSRKANLRALIVDSTILGKGVGRKLIHAALDWADRMGVEEVELWTFKGLDVARKLYDGCGFVLVEEMGRFKWGMELMLQHFVRKAGGVGRL